MATLKKTSSVREETIQKAVAYFRAVNQHLNENNCRILVSDNKKIAKQHNSSEYLIYYATKCGYFQNLGRALYKRIKDITYADVEAMIVTYNEARKKTRDESKRTALKTNSKKSYKPRGFSLKSAQEKYFVVNHLGEVVCKPIGIRKAKVIAQKHANENPGKHIYICAIEYCVAMDYVATFKSI
jgi:hypothetical protein